MVSGSAIGIDYRRVYLGGLTAERIIGIATQDNIHLKMVETELGFGIKGLEKSADRAPKDLRVQGMLGLLYLLDGLYFDRSSILKAEHRLINVVQENPRNQNPLYQLSAILLAQGRQDDALRLLDQAIAMNPQAIESYICKLVYLRLIGNEDEAQIFANDAIERFPKQILQFKGVFHFDVDKQHDYLYLFFF